MLNRRQFLLGSSAVAGLGAGARAQTGLKIQAVDVVHHTHLDVGYTALPSVIHDLQRRYLDAAVDACRADRNFRWTVETLVPLDEWWRASSAARRGQLVELIHAGQMDVMAMPCNQTPLLNALQWRQMMAWIPADLWRTLNIRAAMQNDVNGMPRAGVMALLDRGINRFLMGLNADSGGPPFRRPAPFWWKMPDGRRIFVYLGQHYGAVMGYLQPAQAGNHLRTDDDSVRAAHGEFVRRLGEIESAGYAYERLILTFTHPQNYDNGGPFPTLAPFIAAWNRLRLEPVLRLTTATAALAEMEKAVGGRAPVMEGEWTDWWANGAASSPRELAASRVAKRSLAAALSPVFGPMPERARPTVEGILKDLCLFDEHTWGGSASIAAPYSLDSLAQFVEKSELAFRPMGMAEALLRRRVRGIIDEKPQGVYVINPSSAEWSGWVKAGKQPVWVERLAPRSAGILREDTAAAAGSPQVTLDAGGWPRAASWHGMRKPLFDGDVAAFLAVGFVPPAGRRTIARMHATADDEKRAAMRKKAERETAAAYGTANFQETPHTLLYTQEIRHQRLAQARRTLELWKDEPRARISVHFERLSSPAPEVLYLAFDLPAGVPLPVFSSGGVPFTPYRDQLPGACRDYFGIDGWAHYAASDGHWLWVTRDAPLVAIGSTHVVERHQAEPANTRRILAMVFDNCWHTNFVADEHGPMDFQFDLVWKDRIAAPDELAGTLAAEPIVFTNPAVHETPAELNDIYRP